MDWHLDLLMHSFMQDIGPTSLILRMGAPATSALMFAWMSENIDDRQVVWASKTLTLLSTRTDISTKQHNELTILQVPPLHTCTVKGSLSLYWKIVIHNWMVMRFLRDNVNNFLSIDLYIIPRGQGDNHTTASVWRFGEYLKVIWRMMRHTQLQKSDPPIFINCSQNFNRRKQCYLWIYWS